MIWYTFHYSVRERKIFWKIISNQCFTCFSTMVWVCLIVNQYSPSVIFGVPSCMCAVPWMRIHGFKLGCVYTFRIKIMFYWHFRCLSCVTVVWSGVKWKCQVTLDISSHSASWPLGVGTSPVYQHQSFFAWNDMVHGCMVYTEHTETAAVSCGTSHASSCRITCEHSESAWEWRIALYKSDQRQSFILLQWSPLF